MVPRVVYCKDGSNAVIGVSSSLSAVDCPFAGMEADVGVSSRMIYAEATLRVGRCVLRRCGEVRGEVDSRDKVTNGREIGDGEISEVWWMLSRHQLVDRVKREG